MDKLGVVFLSLGWLMLQSADGELDYISHGQGMQLHGDVYLAGLFPLHNTDEPTGTMAGMGPCNEGAPNQHGYHLMQAMRFAVEEINNSTLLPGVKLGYQMYDCCSVTACILAALDVVEHWNFFTFGTEGHKSTYYNNSTQRVLALIGPDSSSKTFVPATLLGAYFVPQGNLESWNSCGCASPTKHWRKPRTTTPSSAQSLQDNIAKLFENGPYSYNRELKISYEASNEQLSNKFVYPSFFRTIPNDNNQVAAIIQILVRFNWTWVAILGGDNAYGLGGMQGLAEQAPHHGICIAYQGVIPQYRNDTIQTMKNIVENLLKTQVNTIAVFANKEMVAEFFPFVIQRNMRNKVWIGSEDWSESSTVSTIPGIHSIGTVLGVSIKFASISGFEDFERRVLEAAMQNSDTQNFSNVTVDNDCLQSTDMYTLARMDFPLERYDITSSANVYKGTYAVAHALHQTLECNSGECQKRRVHPWELLAKLKQVHFTLDNTAVYFDANGNPPTGYDIICWIWRGGNWSIRQVGSFSPDPNTLTIDADLIEWHTINSTEVPLSICSPPCPSGYRKLLTGQHICCFDCLPCPAATFVNMSDPTTCQPCQPEEWAPPTSEQCLKRTVLLLEWDDPLAIALLFFLACCLLMTSSSAIILLLNLNTPVAKSAGGRTCLLMLAALTAAAMSSLCHFGQPSPLACILKQPLFIFSFTVCLACITVRALQVVCIFKFASKLPPAYDKWAKKHGPEVTIFLVSSTILCISFFRVALNPPQPSQDLAFYADSIVLECSNTLSPGSALELAYVALLSILCFSFSYMGKDLPANYNEAKSVTFSLMVYMISWMSFFTLYLISRGPFTIAAYVFAILFSVLAFFGGYFLPKIYIIVLKPQMNTTAHFQNCIQMYTMSQK